MTCQSNNNVLPFFTFDVQSAGAVRGIRQNFNSGNDLRNSLML